MIYHMTSHGHMQEADVTTTLDSALSSSALSISHQ